MKIVVYVHFVQSGNGLVLFEEYNLKFVAELIPVNRCCFADPE